MKVFEISGKSLFGPLGEKEERGRIYARQIARRGRREEAATLARCMGRIVSLSLKWDAAGEGGRKGEDGDAYCTNKVRGLFAS